MPDKKLGLTKTERVNPDSLPKLGRKTNTQKINDLFGTDLAEPAGSKETDPNENDVGFDPKTGKTFSLKAKPGKTAKSKPAEVK